MTIPIEAMLQHQAKSSQFLSIGEPGATLHPCWIGRALSTYHQEHWATWLVEGIIHKVPLRNDKRREGYEDKEVSWASFASVHIVFTISQEGTFLNIWKDTG